MRNITHNLQSGIVRLLVVSLAMVGLGLPGSNHVMAQLPDLKSRHYMYDYEMPPGEIAFRKTLARQSMVGYFQPVRFLGPDRSSVEVFSEGSFQTTQQRNQLAGLMVGHIYRLKVTNIPGHAGKELFPSVEIIGRLFPPQGQETQFPIPVNLDQDDLEAAMKGALVTRVIYLENPRTAIAEQRGKNDQPFFDVGTAEDPLREAERLGRPMAIVRVGSRVPDVDELNAFGFGTPPMNWYDSGEQPQLPAGEAPPGPDDNNALQYRAGSVQQVAWQDNEETVPIRRDGVPTLAKRPASPKETPAVAQRWSVNDAGVVHQTGLRQNGAVQGVVEEAPVPQFTTSLQSVVDCGPQLVECPPVTGPAMFQQAQPMLPPWPDEVLCDGGDRDLQALVKDLDDRWEVRGLDTEDTIAHFNTLDGRRIVDASNKVCIYAPRFAAVRKVDYLGRTQYTNQIGRVDDEVAANMSRRTDFSSTTLQNLQPTRSKSLTQAVGVENRTRGVRVENVMPLKVFDGTFKTYENLKLVRTGFLDNREKGRLSIAIQRAVAWNSDVSAQSANGKLQIIVVNDVRTAEEAIHIKNEKNRPQLRLVKVASTDAAHPGDYVDFTIRFDNVGDQPIGNVTIMDNLTGRLDYIDGTAECSVPAELITEPNDAGSLILRWEITDALPATKGGVIRFRCRVR